MRRLYIFIVPALLIFSQASYAQCDSLNTAISNKIKYLGEWSSNGDPLYKEDPSDTVPEGLVDFVEETLPESVLVPENSSYFSDNAQLNTVLNDTSEVFLTFVTEGAGWKNSLGFYTYPTDQPPTTLDEIDSLVVILPNSSSPPLEAGDKIRLGEFPPNTTIGYFLIARGWSADTVCLGTHIIFTDRNLNTYIQEGYKQQTIQLNYPEDSLFLLGFEDQIRPGGDNDFNDVVFYVKAKADTSNIPQLATATISGDTILCDPEAPASLKVDFTGKAPYTFTYSNGDEEVTVENVTEKSYEFTTLMRGTVELVSMKDVDGFGITRGSATITQKTLTASFPQDIHLCDGENIPSIDLHFTGEGLYDLTYTNGTDTTEIKQVETYSLTPEINTTYRLLSLENQECAVQLTDTFIVEMHSAPELSVLSPQRICEGEEFEEITLQFSGEGPYNLTYDLNGVQSTLSTTDTSEVLTINGPVNFTPVSFSNEYCQGETPEAVEILLAEKPNATIMGGGDICNDESTEISFSFTGAAPFTLTYSLNGEQQLVESENYDYEFTTSEPGVYKLVSVQDQFCSSTLSDSIEVIDIYEELNAILDGPEKSCEDEEIPFTIDISGNYTGISWSTSGKGSIEETEDGIVYIPDGEEEGTIEISAELTTQCGAKTFSTAVEIIDIGDIDFTVSPNQPMNNSDVVFIASQNDLDDYDWSFGDGNSGSNSQTVHIYDEGGQYIVKLIVSKDGCEADIDKTIDVYSKDALYVPNVFNPNASNPENRVVKVYGNDVSNQNFYFRIVNRWGNIMYETSSFDQANSQGWNGVDPDFDEPQPLTVFSYILRGQFNDGTPFERTGTVTLLR